MSENILKAAAGIQRALEENNVKMLIDPNAYPTIMLIDGITKEGKGFVEASIEAGKIMENPKIVEPSAYEAAPTVDLVKTGTIIKDYVTYNKWGFLGPRVAVKEVEKELIILIAKTTNGYHKTSNDPIEFPDGAGSLWHNITEDAYFQLLATKKGENHVRNTES